MNAIDPRLSDAARQALSDRYQSVRARTEELAAPLSPEDQVVQSMPDASPTKWHRAHTTWFFETFLLLPFLPGYQRVNEDYALLFNSYYVAAGPRHARPRRGLLTRPSCDEVAAYRAEVDRGMAALLRDPPAEALPLIELGLQHEQQHQELLLTDILHAFSCNPLLPAYAEAAPEAPGGGALRWLAHAGGAAQIGHAGPGFAFDNEGPRHAVLLAPFEIASRLVNQGEYLDFIQDGGYRRPELWLSDGWARVQAEGWPAPAYWLAPGDPRRPAGHWQRLGLRGVQALRREAPVLGLSFYEAAAYAEWAGARLPSEFEWELAARELAGLEQLYDAAWQWTRSAYHPYPGFKPLAGAAAEYNGKFMVGQLVLRGASLATPPGHARPSYRNFFPPAARWQFSGLRLARDPLV